MLLHPLLESAVRNHYVHVKDLGRGSLEFAQGLGRVFRARPGDDPVVTMVIEGDDPEKVPYASCRTAQLSLHTDYATFQNPPRFTITHCIEPDPEWPNGGQSITVMMRPLLLDLQAERPELYRFLLTTPLPFRRNREHDRYHDSVERRLVIDEGGRVRFDRTLIEPILLETADEGRDEALKRVHEFDEYCEQSPHQVRLALARDEALIIDNHHVLHSRGPCSIRHEPERILRREVNLIFLE